MTSPPLIDERCPSCGGTIALEFCEICGERKPSHRIYTLRAFAHEAFEVVTNVERSFLRTLRTLIAKPGELVAAYMRGERVNYLRPLQFFLLVNFAYFLIAGWVGIYTFSTPLNSHLHSSVYADFAKARVAERVAATGLTEEDYRFAFDRRVVVLARSLVIVMVPIFAAVAALLTLRRRRPTPAVQHVVFSLHFFNLLMLLAMGVWAVYKSIQAALQLLSSNDVRWQIFDAIVGVLTIGGIVAYLVPALRRAYDLGRVRSVVTSLLLVYAFYWVLTGYRFLLFLIITSRL